MKKTISFFFLFSLSVVFLLWVGGCATETTAAQDQGISQDTLGQISDIEVLDTLASDMESAHISDITEGETEMTEEEEAAALVAKSIPKPVLKPRLKVQNSVYEYGFIDEGDKISHTFVIENTGKATLKIEEILPACGCTVAKLSRKNIRPGDQATLKVDFDSKDKFGKQNKVIEILSNAGYHKVKLVGVVYPKDFKKEGEEVKEAKPDNSGAE